MISARRAALLGLNATLSPVMVAVIGLLPEAATTDAVVGGWWPDFGHVKRKRREPEPEPETAQIAEHAAEMRLAQRRALRDAERRDQSITAQLKAIYAEQDALALTVMQVEAAQQFQAQEAEDLALILALAS